MENYASRIQLHPRYHKYHSNSSFHDWSYDLVTSVRKRVGLSGYLASFPFEMAVLRGKGYYEYTGHIIYTA